MKVGVFDSGVGGLSVVKSLLTHQLFEQIIYYGDTARVPYGIKDKNTIIRYGMEAIEFFKNFELDLIVVACNTVSAYALDEMRDNSICPVVGVVEAGVLATSNKLKDKTSNILILGTKATINSQLYEKSLQKLGYKNLISKATTLFVPIVEEEIYSGTIVDEVFKHYFKDIKTPDAIILGCTHFPMLSDALMEYFSKDTLLIHSGEAIVEYLKKRFVFSKKFKDTDIKFFASQNPESLKITARKWLNNV